MAEIPEYERQIANSPFNVSPVTGAESVGRAIGGTLGVFEKALSNALVKKAAERGTLEALRGETEGKKLPLALGRAQSAYNDAVSNIEARRAVIDYGKKAEQEYLYASDPSKFNLQTPQTFMKRLDEAKGKYISTLRPEAQAKAQPFLEQVQADLETKMISRGIGYNNAVQKQDFNEQLQELKRRLDTYERAGDEENAKYVRDQLNQHLTDYGIKSEEIKRDVPEIKRRIEESSRVNKTISEFLDSAADGKEAEFMGRYFSKGPQGGITYDEWFNTMKEMASTENMRNKMLGEMQAQTMLQLKNEIDSNQVTSVDEIMGINPDMLGTTDKLKAVNYYEDHLRKEAKRQAEIYKDQRYFAEGRGAAVSESRLKEYFSDAVDAMQVANEGQPVSLLQMANSMLGQNNYPTSGIKGVSINTDVGTFNNIMSAQLRNKDNPAGVAEAASIWNYLVNTNKSPQLVSLDSESLAIASNVTDLLLGGNITPEQAAKDTLSVVMDKSDPKIKAARARFESKIKRNIPAYFKQTFGIPPEEFVDDKVLGIFEDIFRTNYMLKDSESAALMAAQSAMSSWGTSKFARKNQVVDHPLEKEFVMANIGNAAKNQQAIRLQEIIDRNENLSWVAGATPIDMKNASDKDKVYGNFPFGGPVRMDNIISVNGYDTPVYMDVDKLSGLIGEGKYRYYFYYVDKFGREQALIDAGSPTGQAYWDPVELDEYAPEIYKEQEDKKLLEDYKKSRSAQFKAMLEASGKYKFLNPDILSGFLAEFLEKQTGEITIEDARRFFAKKDEEENQ